MKNQTTHSSHFPILFFIQIFMVILFQILQNINTALKEDEFILTFTENALWNKALKHL